MNNLKRLNRHLSGPERPEHPFSLPRKFSSSKLRKARMISGIPGKSDLTDFSAEPLNPSNTNAERPPKHYSNILNRKVSDMDPTMDDLMKKEHVASKFLSVLVNRGRLIRHKIVRDLRGEKVILGGEEVEHLTNAKRLLFLRALEKEPLAFLDLHVRFGASKQTIRSLVKRGLLKEVWGPKAVGVRFKLSGKGKGHLEKLEAASEYELRTTRRNFVRLKCKPT